MAAVIARTATRAVQKRQAKEHNGTTSDLPDMIVRHVLTSVERRWTRWCRCFGCVGSPSEMPLMSPSSLNFPGCRAFLRRLRAFWYTPVVGFSLPCLPSVREFLLRLHVLLNVSRLCDLFFRCRFVLSDLHDSYVPCFGGNLNSSPGDAIREVMFAFCQESPVSCHVAAWPQTVFLCL